MSLDEARTDELLIIKKINAGRHATHRLLSLGINEGDRIRVLHFGPFKGAILVEDLDSGVRVALGRGIARKISVERVPTISQN